MPTAAKSPFKTLLKAALIALGCIALLALAAGLYLRHQAAPSETDAAALAEFFAKPAALSHHAKPAAPCREDFPRRKAWFGALHVHTQASFDARAFGVANDADAAYGFARGQPLELRLASDPADAAVPVVRLDRPLDFMAVTDHAEGLGERRLCELPGHPAYGSLPCRVYRGGLSFLVQPELRPLLRLASQALFGGARSARICGESGDDCLREAALAWDENQRATEAWQDSSADCEFTTFHGYEYTLSRDASNLHRNVIFANAEVPLAAASARDIGSPEGLWEWLNRSCRDAGGACDALSIPHNSNWSSGRMWHPYTRQDLPPAERARRAALRAELEPLAEIMQVKGDSECRNGLPSVLGGADEFCDFEKLRPPRETAEDCGEEVGRRGMMLTGCVSRYSYVRYALTAGLGEQAALGINPFRMGIIAATDTHNGAPDASREASYFGATGTDRDAAARLRGPVDVPGGIARGTPSRYNPGGLAGIWARENSRQALFAAMRRRETFGTSGPRIEPRFFAGRFPTRICQSSNMVEWGYADGSPMGSTYYGAFYGADGKRYAEGAPRFLAAAVRDPQGNPLQRIQIIKGWLDEQGRTRQKVINVAGDPDNGAGVHPDTCEPYGSGFDQLCAVWIDPELDPDIPAVYYMRVLENPSCRWSAWQCLNLNEDEPRPPACDDPDLPRTVQERAWTSPIWYQPTQPSATQPAPPTPSSG